MLIKTHHLQKKEPEYPHITMAFLSLEFFPSSSSIKVFAIIIVLILLSHNVAANKLLKNETFPAAFAFGDSILDTGNNDNIISITKSDFPPYGRDFMGGMLTGRFSNGRVPSDFVAEEFGVKKILPAYLDPNLQLQDLLTGVCFASGGSGYDPYTPKLQAAFSLSDQSDFFREYKGKIIAALGEEGTATLISKSVYIVGFGSNDIANTYFSTSLRNPHYDIPSYTDFLLESATNFVQELYALGARVIGVFNLPPLGCLPSQRTQHGDTERACYEAENQASVLFNSKLSTQIDFLNKRLREAQFIYLDIYTPLLSMIQNPAQYGFEVVDKGCCGTGTIEVGPLCNKDSCTCSDATKYLFWDAYKFLYRFPARISNKFCSPL